MNNSSSKEENINDKVNNTSGHHYTIDDIDTKTLIAPKKSNYEFKQVYVQNNKKKCCEDSSSSGCCRKSSM